MLSNRPNKSPPFKHLGLTLIELLVAISVLAFVAILGWRGLDSIVRARITLTDNLEQTRGMQLAFAQLQSDCAHLASPSVLPDRVPLTFEQGRLILVRTVFSDNQPSRLQVISYQVRDGVLSRRESAVTRDYKELDSLWLAAKNDTDTSQAVVLQTDVAALTMRLWISGSNGWRNDASMQVPSQPNSLSTPNSGTGSSLPLPTGLEVTLQQRGRNAGMLKIFLLGAM